jgi:hypothetical protein
MAKDKKSFRDELEKLASIADIIDDSILSKGNVKVIIEMNPEDYKKVLKNFADVYQNLEELVIDISGVNFTFVSKT